MEYFLLCLRGTGGSSSSCLRFYFDGTVGRVVLQRKKFTIRSVHNLLHYLGSPSETDPSPLSSQKMRRPIIADKLRPCYAAATFATKASCTGPIPVLAPQRPDHGGYDLRRTAAPAPRRPQLSNAPSELTFGLVAATSPLACSPRAHPSPPDTASLPQFVQQTSPSQQESTVSVHAHGYYGSSDPQRPCTTNEDGCLLPEAYGSQQEISRP
jgi:hypothetical protein